jgi:hypothetical protein
VLSFVSEEDYHSFDRTGVMNNHTTIFQETVCGLKIEFSVPRVLSDREIMTVRDVLSALQTALQIGSEESGDLFAQRCWNFSLLYTHHRLVEMKAIVRRGQAYNGGIRRRCYAQIVEAQRMRVLLAERQGFLEPFHRQRFCEGLLKCSQIDSYLERAGCTLQMPLAPDLSVEERQQAKPQRYFA